MKNTFRSKEVSDKIVTGKYRHFKGKSYEVIGVARHSETLEEVVIYKALYGDEKLWVRPIASFLESVEVNGRRVERFQLVRKTKA